MSSEGSKSCPSFKHLKSHQRQSSAEIREKLRKSYKEKVHSSRNIIFNNIRGNLAEDELHITLTNIYKDLFKLEDFIKDEEDQLLKEIQNDLIKEELDWWMKEYEKCQNNDMDWAALDKEEVICPVCEKFNLNCNNGKILCLNCNISVTSQSTLPELKCRAFEALEKHSNVCNSSAQFEAVSDTNEVHIYLMCHNCHAMEVIL